MTEFIRIYGWTARPNALRMQVGGLDEAGQPTVAIVRDISVTAVGVIGSGTNGASYLLLPADQRPGAK